GDLARNEGKLAESAYYMQKQLQFNPENTGMRVGLAFQLNALCLKKEATNLVLDTDYSVLQYAFNDNLELFLSQVKDGYPRQENDFWGSFLRATAEEFSGNYKESIKYRNMQGCNDCMALLKTYKLAGDMGSFETLYESRIERHNQLKADGTVGLNFTDAQFHALDGNSDLAIESLKKAVTIDGFPIDFFTMNDPSFAAVRKHPQWPELLELSEDYTTKQRQIYLGLIAKDTEI
ncbi:MAG: hypothetical protein HKP09_06270, partial [Enterobacterales bacterium]|nr:hypothetical protein [Enterobacterales bacterium]